jgi:hypothetical protein
LRNESVSRIYALYKLIFTHISFIFYSVATPGNYLIYKLNPFS